jgi:cholesterol transport system auxiliary component
LILSGCTLPRPASTPVVYDFGPGATQTLPNNRMAMLPTLEVGTPQTSAALNSPAVLYRLGYADAQQLKPYTLARWSMPPAQLIGQRLREHLGLRRAIVSPGEIIPASQPRQTASAAAAATPAVKPETLLNLRLELEEFSQLFETPDKSFGLLRVRATLTQRSTAGETLLAQRSFVAQPAATTPDASGGVRALTAATDQLIGEIEVWLEQVGPATRAP